MSNDERTASAIEAKLLPCPFCSSSLYPRAVEDKELSSQNKNDGWWVICDGAYPKDGCGASSGWRRTRDEAVRSWNARKFVASQSAFAKCAVGGQCEKEPPCASPEKCARSSFITAPVRTPSSTAFEHHYRELYKALREAGAQTQIRNSVWDWHINWVQDNLNALCTPSQSERMLPLETCNTHGYVGPGRCPQCAPSSIEANDAEIVTLFDRAIKGMRMDVPPGAIPALYRLMDIARTRSAIGEWKRITDNDATRGVAWIDEHATHVAVIEDGKRYLLTLPKRCDGHKGNGVCPVHGHYGNR